MKIREQDDITIVTLTPKFDAFAPRREEAELLALVEQGARRVIFDCSETTIISSAGFRVIIKMAQALKAANGKFLLCALQPPVQKLYTLVGGAQVVAAVPTLAEALTRLRDTPAA